MGKIKTDWKLPPLCLPVALLGANVSGRPNFFTIVWFNMIQDDPPLLVAGIGQTHYTRKGIKKNKTFSINIPSSQLAEIVDFCGLHSGLEVDKSSLFKVFYGELETAPMIDECVLNLECRLEHSKKFNSMELIVGEIVRIYCEERCLTKSKPDYLKMDPLLFFMPQGPYFRAGEFQAEAFKIGRRYQKRKQ